MNSQSGAPFNTTGYRVTPNHSLKLTRNGLPRWAVGGRFAHFPPTAQRGKPLRSA